MSNVVVYVFLLDNLAGFNKALNESLIMNTPNSYRKFTPVIRKCDVGTTEQILDTVSRDLEMEMVPNFKTSDKHSLTNEESQETLLYNALMDTSLPELDGNEEYIQKQMDSFENASRRLESNRLYEQFYDEPTTEIYNESITETNKVTINIQNEITETINKITEYEKNFTKTVGFPKNAPFLVAIFETLSNTTAQTCAGTLIASRWVLTASNCMNILANLYANNTNVTEHQSMYTVVAGATDPLSDGSVHNVTMVLQHHGFPDNSIHRKSVHLEIGPYLAMLEIEPEVEGAGLQLVEEKITKGDVMIYGWIMTKDDSGHESLQLMMMSALILSSAECQAMYNYNNNDVICLFNNEKEMNITQLSSGGPVLIIQGEDVKMLAVVQTDEHVFIAYPLYMHFSWIKKILDNKV